MATVGVSKIASALNLSEQRVQQLVKEGMPRESRGQYDPIKCLHFYIRFLQRAIEARETPTLDTGFVGERHARVRLLSADADLRELRLAEQRGNLVATPDVEMMLADLVNATTARIMKIPAQMAPELVGETSRLMILAKLEKAFKAALHDLAVRGLRRRDSIVSAKREAP